MIRLANRGDLNGIFRLICEMEQSELDYKSFRDFFTTNLNPPVIPAGFGKKRESLPVA